MERPIFQPVGTPVEDLDTPALVVDLEVMEHNIETMHSAFRNSPARLRPNVSVHQCPQVAHRQLAAGGTVGGIAVATVGEAAVFAAAGFNDILVANQVVTRSKINALCGLAQSNRIAVAVDNPNNVATLSEVASLAGVRLHVVVEVDVGSGVCGVTPGENAIELARLVDQSSGLEFDGLLAREGESHQGDRASIEADTRRRLEPVLETRRQLEQTGVSVSTVAVGGTHNYDVAGQLPGVTEVMAGSYPLMDYASCQFRTEFSPAAKILGAVIGHPVEERAVLDAGHKATGPDLGVPVLEGFAGATASRFSAEHGIIDLEGEAVARLAPMDKALLVPYSLALTINQYDYIRAIRNGKLEGFWPISARGQFG
jgi:D-serine deaminase-like pyridoxal phosphate-dependent protein